jgi:hypothetical protein
MTLENFIDGTTRVIGTCSGFCIGMARRVWNRHRQLGTSTLRRPWFVRIESMGINEYDAASAAFIETGRVQRSVRPGNDNGTKKSAAADMTSKGALAHCLKTAESDTVCLYSTCQ